jgi:hypothetical protein
MQLFTGSLPVSDGGVEAASSDFPTDISRAMNCPSLQLFESVKVME